MSTDSVGTRPGSRRDQLLQTAAQLFQTRGYHNTTLEDITETVGLTGPALYRHFRNKHDLLAQVMLEQIGAVLGVCERAAVIQDPETRMEQFLAELGVLMLERDDVMLWKQERRHLTGEEQTQFRDLAQRVVTLAAEIVAGVRPELGEADRRMVSWALLSVHSYARTYRRRLDRAAVLTLLKTMSMAVVTSDIGLAPVVDELPRGPYWPAGRRERIIEAAVRLLDGRGFYAVSIEEIAAESETAIATVYQYFTSKTDLLRAILVRGVEGTNYVTTHRLWTVPQDRSRLDLLVSDYAQLTFGPHGRLLGIFEADVIYLPAAEQERLGRSEHENALEWVAALTAERPELSAADSWVRARTALGLLADLAQTRSIKTRAGSAGRAMLLAQAVLQS